MSDYMKQLINGEEIAKLQQQALKEALETTPSESTALESVEKKRWEPKEWRPEYQMIVILSTMNFSGEKIVEVMRDKYNYEVTKQHVSNILNCTKAKEIKAQISKNVEERTKRTVEENLSRMEELAAERIVEALEDDDLMKSSPFAMFDRSIKVLEGRQKLKNGNNYERPNQVQNNFLSLPPEILNRIENGLNKANEVHQLHGPKYDTTESTVGEVKRSGTDG